MEESTIKRITKSLFSKWELDFAYDRCYKKVADMTITQVIDKLVKELETSKKKLKNVEISNEERGYDLFDIAGKVKNKIVDWASS